MVNNHSLPVRLGIAVVLVSLACGLSLAIEPIHDHDPFLLFFAAVLLTLWYCRLGPGLLAIFLSIELLDYFFLPPLYSLGLSWDQTVVASVFSLMALAIHSIQVHHDRLERKVHHTEDLLGLAQRIQRNLFPHSPLRLPGFETAGICHPADETGGDYFDFIQLRDGSLGIALGDVSGHGIGPALVMAEVHAYVRALSLQQRDPGQILTLANRLIHEDTQDNQFVTAFLGVLDPRTRTLIYASAGQQGFVMDATGKVTSLETTGLPLGIDPGEAVSCAPVVRLEEGSLLVLVTDGVFEAMAPDRKQFGVERTMEVIRRLRDQSPEQIADAVCRAVKEYVQGAPASDDVTVVIIKSVGADMAG